MITAQLKNKLSRISPFVDWITEYEPKFLWINSLTHLEYDCHIFVVTVVTILEQKQYIWKQKKLFSVEMLLFYEKNIYRD